MIPDAVPSGYGAPSASYVGRGQISVSWSVPAGSFSPVSSTDLQILANGSVVTVRIGVGPPLLLDGLDSGAVVHVPDAGEQPGGFRRMVGAERRGLPSDVPSAPQRSSAAYRSTAAASRCS